MATKTKSWNEQKFKEKPFLEPTLFDFNVNMRSFKPVKKHATFNEESIGKRYHWTVVQVSQWVTLERSPSALLSMYRVNHMFPPIKKYQNLLNLCTIAKKIFVVKLSYGCSLHRYIRIFQQNLTFSLP